MIAERRRPRLRWPVLAGGIAAVIVIAVIVAIAVARTRSGERPPAFQSSADAFRLTAPPANLPSVDYASVPTSHGRRYLLYGDITDGGRTAKIWVSDHKRDPRAKLVSLTVVQTTVIDDVRVRVLHIWAMPDPSHNAIDVSATAG
jgi:hypothetical protein